MMHWPPRSVVISGEQHGLVEKGVRTLFLWSERDYADNPFAEGDPVTIPPHQNFPRGAACIVTSVTTMKLGELTDADLVLLGLRAREEYLATWDSLHPDADERAAANPTVYRVAFRIQTQEDCERITAVLRAVGDSLAGIGATAT